MMNSMNFCHGDIAALNVETFMRYLSLQLIVRLMMIRKEMICSYCRKFYSQCRQDLNNLAIFISVPAEMMERVCQNDGKRMPKLD